MNTEGLWSSWIAENGEAFFLYARQKTRSESDAKDVLQDALTEAWRRTSEGLPERSLVFATIRRRAIDCGRSIDRRSKREIKFADDSPNWFVPDFSANDVRHQLASAIETLPETLSEVLFLKIWGDLTFPAISKLINIPVATATSRYRYALERLRECTTLTELMP
ncbi:MAG: sigma-70 family RNA polymerase sigma factor [Akkermansiaceae bacterium]